MSKLKNLIENYDEITNLTIFDSFVKAHSKLKCYKNIVCSISGGADSDIVIDILSKLDEEKKIKYVFFDTGIEYEATKKHLDFLEAKYGVKIDRYRAKIPVPLGCRKYGVPFWSKYASEMIGRLQKHGFKWENRDFDELLAEYPKCGSALKWWCNKHGENSKFNISNVPLLKEFMILNPPTFKISNKCCHGAKKDNAKDYKKINFAELSIIGIRKAEGGIRSSAYKSCFDEKPDCDNYRPIFWYTNKDKLDYEEIYAVKHSDCYCKYGLKRTGCAGCPFGKDFEFELEVIKEYEPKLFRAVNKIFGESYEYTRKFLRFREEATNKNQQIKGQISLFDNLLKVPS